MRLKKLSSHLSFKACVIEKEYKNMECLGWRTNEKQEIRERERNGWGAIRNFSDDIWQYYFDRATLSFDFALKLTWLIKVSSAGRGFFKNQKFSWQNHCHRPYEEFYFLSCSKTPPKPFHGEFHKVMNKVIPCGSRVEQESLQGCQITS